MCQGLVEPEHRQRASCASSAGGLTYACPVCGFEGNASDFPFVLVGKWTGVTLGGSWPTCSKCGARFQPKFLVSQRDIYTQEYIQVEPDTESELTVTYEATSDVEIIKQGRKRTYECKNCGCVWKQYPFSGFRRECPTCKSTSSYDIAPAVDAVKE